MAFTMKAPRLLVFCITALAPSLFPALPPSPCPAPPPPPTRSLPRVPVLSTEITCRVCRPATPLYLWQSMRRIDFPPRPVNEFEFNLGDQCRLWVFINLITIRSTSVAIKNSLKKIKEKKKKKEDLNSSVAVYVTFASSVG